MLGKLNEDSATVKKCSFYIAQYTVRWTGQIALHFFPPSGRPVHSDTNSASLGSILVTQQLRGAKTKSLTFPPLSIANWVNWGVNGEKENVQCSKR